MSGDLEELKKLVEHTPGIVNNSFIYNYDKLATPLYIAARSGHYDLVEFLIHSSADINALNSDGNSPAFAAVVKGHTEIVKLLVEHGVDVNQKYNKYDDLTILIQASIKGDTKIVKYLLKQGADVNHRDDTGDNPLFNAADYSRNNATISRSKATIRELVMNGGELNNFGDKICLLDKMDRYVLNPDLVKYMDDLKKKKKLD